MTVNTFYTDRRSFTSVSTLKQKEPGQADDRLRHLFTLPLLFIPLMFPFINVAILIQMRASASSSQLASVAAFISLTTHFCSCVLLLQPEYFHVGTERLSDSVCTLLSLIYQLLDYHF